ncbi:MAG: shikimate dehydrogenase family protein [Chthoniobacterales bacterium]
MKDVYTIDDLGNWSEETIRLGVIGDPVAHSLSPQMQNAALRACGIPLEYARFEIRANELAEALELFAQREFIGLNVTVPHKAAVMPLMSETYEPAKSIDAANTAVRSGGRWHGFNTDAQGFSNAIREDFDIAPGELRVLVLGTGGAARAIAWQCKAEGCRAVQTWSRKANPDPRELAREADLIVNATPVGLSRDDVPLLTRDAFRRGQFVYDTIYNPVRTRLLEEAAAAGAQTANGLSMLLHQGARAFEVWFGQSAPLDPMRAALRGFA